MNEVPDTFNSLFIGYAAIWTLVVLYIVSLLRRVRSLERRLDERSKPEECK
jgi:CcmD family protein